ncbi:MAG: aminotransferase class I/II-fold pyridoxal phosphate-dependent enzyme [Gammaproteobacteria bacterium]|nr:aminotransferase class I/II-fold pyridoxal phosphate-dependent enzyme [Gammaproteobacteria bacterium]
MTEYAGLNTLCVHAAHAPEKATGAVAEPIYLSTTFERDADGAYPRGYTYSREGTPNRIGLEGCVAQLEGGIGAAAFASGLAANMAVLELLAAGDRLLASREGYYGSLRQFAVFAERRGARLALVDLADAAAVRGALTEGAGPGRLLWIETPTNPLLNIVSLEELVPIAHRSGALVVCDNTFATPVCQRPFDFGVDLIVHSATKYLGGHSDVLGGVVAVRESGALLERMREWQKMAGAVLAPFDCWLLRRSLTTLALRVRKQCAGALEVAEFLAQHRGIEQVFYPGLPTHPAHGIAARQMHGGFGAMLSVCVAGGRDAAMRLAAGTRVFTRATSLGGIESLIEHRASIEGPGTRVPENLLRLSIGIEEPEDLIADLEQALRQGR